MTVKSFVRFIIGIGIALLLLSLAAPPTGIPRAQLFPPMFIYGSATGKAQGVVTKTYTEMTRNIFKTGERNSLVDYEFQGPYVPLLLANKPSGAGDTVKYAGTVQVSNDSLNSFTVGMPVPIRYEKTYPVISGIDQANGGRNIGQGSGLLSGWLIWAFVTLTLGYIIAGFLERIMLRESY
jgi:hypothetical protein